MKNRKLENFEKALTELKAYLALPVENQRDRAGIIQGFEFTFEQSWKSIQALAHNQGVQVQNPRSAFTYALQNAWIDRIEEPQWLSMIQDRNLTSHTYLESLAIEVLGRIQNSYENMFSRLFQALKKNWVV